MGDTLGCASVHAPPTARHRRTWESVRSFMPASPVLWRPGAPDRAEWQPLLRRLQSSAASSARVIGPALPVPDHPSAPSVRGRRSAPSALLRSGIYPRCFRISHPPPTRHTVRCRYRPSLLTRARTPSTHPGDATPRSTPPRKNFHLDIPHIFSRLSNYRRTIPSIMNPSKHFLSISSK